MSSRVPSEAAVAPSKALLVAARTDLPSFASLADRPLFPYQEEVARHPARVKVLRSGRQSGKTFYLAVEAAWSALRKPRQTVLILSAGEASAREVVRTVSDILGEPVLSVSVEDENSLEIVLSNGSRVVGMPASSFRTRGRSIDLLCVDECCFVKPEVLYATLPVVVARPGSRVILASTPFGSRQSPFALYDLQGDDFGDLVARWHWPATASPLVDEEMMRLLRVGMTESAYRREFLAEWTSDEGCLFSFEQLEAITDDYEIAGPCPVAAVDWGKVKDACTMVGLRRDGDDVVRVGALLERFGSTYTAFVELVCAQVGRLGIETLVSETNGVGLAATELLENRVAALGLSVRVVPATVSNQWKQEAYGRLETLVQHQELRLPRHPALLEQLMGVERTLSPSGNVLLSVPERRGHDDLCSALVLAAWHLGDSRAAAWAARRKRALALSPGSLVKESVWRSDSPGGEGHTPDRWGR